MLSKLAVELPIGSIFPTILLALIYYPCNLNPGWEHFFKALMCNVLLGWLSLMIAIFFSTLIKDQRLVIEVSPIFVIPSIVFSGLLANIGRLKRNTYPRVFLFAIYLAIEIYL